jgi:NitT/TauT family transport system permease protein
MHNWILTICPHIGFSLFRVFFGLALGFVCGASLGFLMHLMPQADRFFSKIIYLTYPFPKVVLVPLFILMFGIGEMSKIALIFIIVFYQILVSTRDLIKQINPRMLMSIASLGAGTIDQWRHVFIPYCLPGWFTCLRLSLGTSLGVLFFAETYATQWGLGFYIWDAFSRFDYIDLYGGSFTLCGIGFLLFWSLEKLEAVMVPWNRN